MEGFVFLMTIGLLFATEPALREAPPASEVVTIDLPRAFEGIFLSTD